jgi:hypothetical protein
MNKYNNLIIKKGKGLTVNDIADFCVKNKNYCQDNRQKICKKILKIIGYLTPKKFDNQYCMIYKELKRIDPTSSVYKKNYLLIGKETQERLQRLDASSILVEFLKANGINTDFAKPLPKLGRTQNIVLVRNTIGSKSTEKMRKPSLLPSKKRKVSVKPELPDIQELISQLKELSTIKSTKSKNTRS